MVDLTILTDWSSYAGDWLTLALSMEDYETAADLFSTS
jgi:hypothetical protein